MVCRECGAYNADNLTHCRVCAAKLRDTEPAATAATADNKQETQAEGRPARDFVKAPSWPTHAYTGASSTPAPVALETPEEQPAAPASSASYTPLSASDGGLRSAIPPRKSAPAPKATCPNCGKPALPDAPFCPYCGQKLSQDEPAAAPAAPAAARTAPVAAKSRAAVAAAPARPAKRAPEPTDFDDDFEDDEDDEDEAPAKGRKFGKAAAKKPAKKSRRDDEYDDDEDEDEFDDEYDDDEYDDDEYDDEDFDDMPKKKSKGTTILFWGLIVLLVALIAVFGIYIVQKNFGGDTSQLFSSISSVFGSKKQDDTQNGTTADGTQPVEVEQDTMNTATISEYTDPNSGEVFYDIDIYAPTGSTVRIITDAELQNDTATIPSNDHVILRVAKDVFMPNAPCETEVVTITPNIQVDTPEGETIQLKVDDITVTVPVLTMTVDSPTGDTVQQTYNNDAILITGSVDNQDVREIYVNDVAYPVYEGGIFTLTYTPTMAVNKTQQTSVTAATAAPADTSATPDAAATTPDAETAATEETAEATPTDSATPEATAEAVDTMEPAGDTGTMATTGAGGTETITIEARLNNYVTARKVITVEPFVMQNMALVVSNDPATGLTAKDGVVTLEGTVTEGATLKASCDEAAELTFGEPTVSATGAFTLAVTVAQVGAYEVDLTATKEGYYETTTSTIVEMAPSEKYSTFLKKCTDISKSYDKIVSGEVTTGNFYATGKVTEIISTTPYTVFKVELSDGKSVVCVNRSAKSTINTGDLKEKKQVIGSLRGLYTDGATPYLWGWFSLNKG